MSETCFNEDCEHYTPRGDDFCQNCRREELHASLQRLHHAAREFMVDALFIESSELPVDPAIRFICREVGERLLIMLRLPTFKDVAPLAELEGNR